MKHSDVIVIGSGVAGMTAALASAQQGKSVTLLTYGASSLSLNSGLIDILAFDDEHKAVKSPLEGIKSLPADHPYSKIGADYLEKAVDFFCAFAKKYHLPYHGSLNSQMMVPTAVGTLKPTCLAPHSLSGSESFVGKKKVVVVGVKGLKDFYADIMIQNLKKAMGEELSYESVEIDTGIEGGRDLTILDVARWLDTPRGVDSFTEQLKSYKGQTETVLIVPQILGTSGHACYLTVASRMETDVVETTGLPPSTNGLRLQAIFRQALKDNGVEFVENTKVIGAREEGGRCTGVIAQAGIRQKVYTADKYILATGGFYSGGITMRDFEQPREEVFGLPVFFVKGEENWSNAELFSNKPQGYAKTGVLTDENLRPVDENGKLVLENVYVVGRDLGGYDLCFEHSGNGVALASGYKAAQM